MASPVAHGLAAYALWVTLDPKSIAHRRSHLYALIASFIFGALADADFFVAPLTDIPDLQHHVFSHSIPFSMLVLLVCFLFNKTLRHPASLKVAILLGIAYSTHLVLDYFTSDGSPPFGIPLFWPFTDLHFVAPVEVFESIHRGSVQILFGIHNWIAVAREVAITLPAALLAFFIARRRIS